MLIGYISCLSCFCYTVSLKLPRKFLTKRGTNEMLPKPMVGKNNLLSDFNVFNTKFFTDLYQHIHNVIVFIKVNHE